MSTAGKEEGMDRARELMMRALDGEISEGQHAELEGLIVSDESLQDEWEGLKLVKPRLSDFVSG